MLGLCFSQPMSTSSQKHAKIIPESYQSFKKIDVVKNVCVIKPETQGAAACVKEYARLDFDSPKRNQ